jgi:transcriptional regulator
MLEQPKFALSDPHELRELISANPWVTMVSHHPTGLVVSHLPIICDPSTSDVVVLGHLARADAVIHELGSYDAVVIVQGIHGYISPSWYQQQPHVPTWDFVVAHCHGQPEVLSPASTLDVLRKTVDHLEANQPKPWSMSIVENYAHQLASATCGFRLRPTRIVGKAKLSQEQPITEAAQLADALDAIPSGMSESALLAAAIRNIFTTSRSGPVER